LSVRLIGSSAGGQQMWTDANDFGDTFECSTRIKHDATIDGVLHSLVEIREQDSWTLDGDEIDEF
jgi:hypothetical protein